MAKSGNISFFIPVVSLLLLLDGSYGRSRPRRQGDILIKSLLDSRKPRTTLGVPVADEESSTPAATTAFDPSNFTPQDRLKEGDRIKALPGQPAEGVDFAQYGGYVTVDSKAGRALFYYFVEAVHPNASSKPLLLWLNGGPGCSSVGLGALTELGPFRVMSDGRTLFRNPYAWNAVANVLFLDSPAGVGYSYSNTTSDYRRSSDARSAEDALVFLLNWMGRFPEYKGRDFYIAGESYAGHFVTQLAIAVCRHNLQPPNKNNTINLKGVLMGNAAINHETDAQGLYDYLWNHAFISDDAISGVRKYCNFSLPDLGILGSRACFDAMGNAFTASSVIWDQYNMYGPVCHSERVTDVPKPASIDVFDPCTDYYLESYLNFAEVQAALHAVTKLRHPWQGCSELLRWNNKPMTVLPLIRELMQHGIRIMVFSGDVDGVVPVTSTRYSINALKLPVKTPWQVWRCRGELGGYSIVYQGGLTLATVRGAGHEVPSYQPQRALVLVTSFLNGEPLPHPVNT